MIGQVPHDALFKQNKGAHIESETGKDIPIPGDNPAHTGDFFFKDRFSICIPG
jgi:hypothetical protein